MKKQMLTRILISVMLSVFLQGQSFTGTYQLTGVKVVYTNIARTIASVDDTLASYLLEANWPNNATPMFSAPLKGFAPGDTIAVVETPDLLLTPQGLAWVGINLSVGLNQEAGSMLIPGIEGTSSTYPTTNTENCSTFAVIAPVTDNANITYSTTSNSWNATDGTFTWGFGISESAVFDWFDAPSDWEDPSNGFTNYGILTGHFNDNNTGFDGFDLKWHAEDGQDSDSGIDDEGLHNRHLGITMVPGDTVTVATLNAVYGTNFNVGSHPILGGTGVDLDQDGDLDGVVNTDWGYYFDPKGPDGLFMNGDEPFQFTGYYFTYTDLAALGAIQTAAGDDANGDGIPDNVMTLIATYMAQGYDQTTATLMAINYVGQAAFVGLATAFGVDSTVAATAAAAVGYYAQTTYVALVTAGDPNALENTAQATAFYAVGVLASLGAQVNDSDHDFNGTNGRLVFQIGNSCVPDYQARDVYALFSAVTLGVESENTIPDKFAVYDNYPNPFNPSTKISFDLTEQADTEVSIWNLLGQKITTLYSGNLNAGHHSVIFSGKDVNGNTLPSGVYIYRVDSGNNVATKKMMLLK